MYGGSRQRNDPLDRKPAAAEDPADGDRVLVVQMPGLLVPIHRVQQVDVQARRSARVRAGEFLHPDIGALHRGNRAALGLAHVDRGALGDPGESGDSPREVLLVPAHDHIDGRGERVAVRGRDKDRGGHGVGHRHLAVGTSAQSRPETGLDEQFANLLAAEFGRVLPGIGVERHAVVPPGQFSSVQLEHDRLQGPSVATVDCGHCAAPLET